MTQSYINIHLLQWCFFFIVFLNIEITYCIYSNLDHNQEPQLMNYTVSIPLRCNHKHKELKLFKNWYQAVMERKVLVICI